MQQKMSGLSDIKTSQKARVHGTPKSAEASYLDLYILSKERDRLEQEKSVVDKRKEQLEANLEDLKQQIETLKKVVPQEGRQIGGREAIKKEVAKKEWKTMTLDY